MDTFELFNNGKLVLPEKETGFAGIEWSKHPTFKGVELKHIITAKDTDGKFSCHFERDSRDMLTRRLAFVLLVVSCKNRVIFHTDSASRGRGMSRSMPSWSAGRG